VPLHRSTYGAEAITKLPALADLGPGSAVIAGDAAVPGGLARYTGDAAIPRANVYGTIPYGHAVLRLAASTQPGKHSETEFGELKKKKDGGVSGFRKCAHLGHFTIVMSSAAGRCQRAAKALLSLDARWAGFVNGTEVGVLYRQPVSGQAVMGQVPRKVAFDGIVPTERSRYPGLTDLTFDFGVADANHQNIYKLQSGLNRVSEAMLAIGMDPANTLKVSLSGPSSYSSSSTLTWRASPTGGNGAYAYQWSYRSSGSGVWTTFGGTGATASRSVTSTTSSFTVRVVVTSAGQTAIIMQSVRNTTTGTCTGSSCPQ